MRRITMSLALLVTFCGCARSPQTINVQVTQPPAAVGSGSDLSSSTATAGATYPEKAEVERLLFLARDLQQKGQFVSSLALVDQALQLDPSSPSAAALKRNLEEIIKRIGSLTTDH